MRKWVLAAVVAALPSMGLAATFNFQWSGDCNAFCSGETEGAFSFALDRDRLVAASFQTTTVSLSLTDFALIDYWSQWDGDRMTRFLFHGFENASGVGKSATIVWADETFTQGLWDETYHRRTATFAIDLFAECLEAADGRCTTFQNSPHHPSFGYSVYTRVDPVAPIPLPAAGWLLLAGIGAVGALRLRRYS